MSFDKLKLVGHKTGQPAVGAMQFTKIPINVTFGLPLVALCRGAKPRRRDLLPTLDYSDLNIVSSADGEFALRKLP